MDSEGHAVDLLFGSDMLKAYHACVYLQQNVLRIQGHDVSFPAEHELAGKARNPGAEAEAEVAVASVSGSGAGGYLERETRLVRRLRRQARLREGEDGSEARQQCRR